VRERMRASRWRNRAREGGLCRTDLGRGNSARAHGRGAREAQRGRGHARAMRNARRWKSWCESRRVCVVFQRSGLFTVAESHRHLPLTYLFPLRGHLEMGSVARLLFAETPPYCDTSSIRVRIARIRSARVVFNNQPLFVRSTSSLLRPSPSRACASSRLFSTTFAQSLPARVG